MTIDEIIQTVEASRSKLFRDRTAREEYSDLIRVAENLKLLRMSMESVGITSIEELNLLLYELTQNDKEE